MANYIGMDAHSKTCMFVVVNSSGQEIKTARVNTSEPEIIRFLGSLRGKKYLTFEECHMSRWLHVVTKDEVDERTIANLTARARRGLYNGGHAPLGYDTDPNHKGYLVINSKEADLVRKVFESYISLGSTELVAQSLNEAGYRTKQRKTPEGRLYGLRPFDDKAVVRVLRNHAYLGKRPVPSEDEKPTFTKAVWPSIVDENAFTLAQEKLETSRNFFKPEGHTEYAYALTGLVKCGECGKQLSGAMAHGKTSDIAYYQHVEKTGCTLKRVQAKRLEDEVFSRMRKAKDDDTLTKFISDQAGSELKKRLPELESNAGSIEQRIRDARKKAANLINVLADLPEGMDSKIILNQVKEYGDLAKTIEEEKERIQLEIKDVRASIVSEEYVRDYLNHFFKNFKKQNLNERGDSLKYVLNYVAILPSKLELNYWAGAFASAPEVPLAPCHVKGQMFGYGEIWRGVRDSNPRPSA